MKAGVLVVEGEEAISEPLAEHLVREGFTLEVAPTIALASGAFGLEPHDIILLAVMLPNADGRDFCREIRKGSDVPILMVTARGEEIDRICAARASDDEGAGNEP